MTGAPELVAVVGNPRPHSRTHRAADRVRDEIARRLGPFTGEGTVDLAPLAGSLLAPRPGPGVLAAREAVAGASVLVVASPTYKATYTGLLKVFLDGLPSGALANTVAVPVLVMGDARHALAVDVHLRPLLIELGATVAPGLALVEADLPRLDHIVTAWADRAAPLLWRVTAPPERERSATP
ncbi:NADPH-dependent FMN reductase [Spirillospora albida]|uniref:NADPH-dependent FMN reductase n=1 Tax=Spirillospora albida TaxID=58123 RepID=UPI0004C01CBF|nr:NADPH-dependent FMN reductase [Spirillospora albida]